MDLGRKNSAILQSLSAWAKGLGKQHCELAQYGAGGGAPCCFSCTYFKILFTISSIYLLIICQYLHYLGADAVILSKVKAALGLDQCKGCFTAAAPIAPETLWYFASLDIPVYEVCSTLGP